MTCLLCNSPATEISRELIQANNYPKEYEIATEPKIEVKYTCDNCKLTFWVLENPTPNNPHKP